MKRGGCLSIKVKTNPPERNKNKEKNLGSDQQKYTHRIVSKLPLAATSQVHHPKEKNT